MVTIINKTYHSELYQNLHQKNNHELRYQKAFRERKRNDLEQLEFDKFLINNINK